MHQLDISNDESVARLHDFLREKFGGVDVLINNAGFAYKNASTAPFEAGLGESGKKGEMSG